MRRIFPLLLLLTACTSNQGPTVAERKAAQLQQYRDQLANEQQTLHVTDSLLAAIIPQINTATSKGFEYEKTEYDDLGRFRPVGTDPGQNVQRTYLRSAVDDYGRTQLIATYCGSKSFVVHQLLFTASDGTRLTTSVVDPNDGSNYSYDIDGTHYQSVTFAFAGKITEGMTDNAAAQQNADTDNGALAYLAQHASDDHLVCHYLSTQGNQQKVAISAKDRANFAATYELGLLLRESVRLQQENKTASLKIQYLQERIASKDTIR